MDELIELSKNGDKNAFCKVILNIKSDLYKIARTRLNDDYDISDAIQETMVKAYCNLKKLKDNSKFKYWIFKILINECNRIYKKKYKTVEKEVIEECLYDEDNPIQNSNSKMDFNLLIDCLDYKEKLVVTLFYNNRYTCEEISKILNMNVNTVKSKLNRAKQKIKKHYKGGGIYE